MRIKSLKVKDFRNYSYGVVNFKNGTNVITGPNAMGKTNILESIFLFATGKSHRGAREKELINYNSENARVEIDFVARGRENKGEIIISSNKKKQFRLNKIPILRTSELMGRLNVVMFCPEDLRIIKGAPRERRREMDLGICQLRANYFHKLVEYNKIIEQRNILLKKEKEETWVWDEQLATVGARICWYRRNYLKELELFAKEHMKNICGEELSIEYINVFDKEEEYIEFFLDLIEKNKDRERRWKQSLVGPHRDDYIIKINGKEARIFGSQGQIRTAAIAIKLGEVDFIKKEVGEEPILLLDDALSELDDARQKYILNKLGNAQVIITCTNAEKFGKMKGVNIIKVEEIKKECISI